MGFIQLVLLEGILLICAGMIFFGGIWGTFAAIVALSGINLLAYDAPQFWYWEIPLIVGGLLGILLLFTVGKRANKTQIVGGLVGGLTSLVMFGAFATPIIAILLWALVFGTGLIPKSKKSQVLWSFAPTILRIMLGICGIIYGNILTA
ncbi:membrane protein [Desulfosporosinus sp. HMP52]|uniref:hypothetical protein n=1 Tax=Desulfosporosinus sp. HMP52 TaxID=1487923 RepID=UPI00051F94BA|nr:hypothetical protein [Desulfosporosinus sp. HMP52]KGK91615.1 membrane protein [Desulfosporosinus sp. HMP52]